MQEERRLVLMVMVGGVMLVGKWLISHALPAKGLSTVPKNVRYDDVNCNCNKT